jgi:hypothetical protein
VRDISSSGAFIETSLELPVGTHLILAVTGNESATREVGISAIVVRVAGEGLGIEWCETPSVPICAAVGCARRCADC